LNSLDLRREVLGFLEVRIAILERSHPFGEHRCAIDAAEAAASSLGLVLELAEPLAQRPLKLLVIDDDEHALGSDAGDRDRHLQMPTESLSQIFDSAHGQVAPISRG